MIDSPHLKTHWFSPLILVLYIAIPLAFWGAVGAGLIWLISLALSGDQALPA